MVSNIYSKSVLHSSPALARQAQVIIYDRLLPILTAASTSPTPSGIDIHEIWNATTMDFITAYQFGLSNGSDFLQNEPERRTWLSFYHSRKTHTFFNQELPKLALLVEDNGRLVASWPVAAWMGFRKPYESWQRSDFCHMIDGKGKYFVLHFS